MTEISPVKRYAKAIVAFVVSAVGTAVSVGLLDGKAAALVGCLTVGLTAAGVYRVPNIRG